MINVGNGVSAFAASKDPVVPLASALEQAAASIDAPGAAVMKTASHLPAGSYYPIRTKKIRYLRNPSFMIPRIRDVGMDMFLVTKIGRLATSGVATCFAVCSIGKTRIGAPVLGLCHMSSLVRFDTVLHLLKNEMVRRKRAIRSTIRTYVIGGQGPSAEAPEGTRAAESLILSLAKRERIAGALFNLSNMDNGDDDGIDIVLTAKHIFVSKKAMFPSGPGVGTNLPY
jgi:hypothetical protein